MWSTAGGHSTNKFSPIVSMWAYNDAETQISREGKRYKVPSNIATLSFFVKLCLDTKDIEDGGDTDRNNGNGSEVVHEILLYAINSFVLAEIVKNMEYYKQDPSEFFTTFCLRQYYRQQKLNR